MKLAKAAPLCAFEKTISKKIFFFFNLIIIFNVTLKTAVKSLHMRIHVALPFLEREILHE
jgi:hypothetical protein